MQWEENSNGQNRYLLSNNIYWLHLFQFCYQGIENSLTLMKGRKQTHQMGLGLGLSVPCGRVALKMAIENQYGASSKS